MFRVVWSWYSYRHWFHECDFYARIVFGALLLLYRAFGVPSHSICAHISTVALQLYKHGAPLRYQCYRIPPSALYFVLTCFISKRMQRYTNSSDVSLNLPENLKVTVLPLKYRKLTGLHWHHIAPFAPSRFLFIKFI